MKFEKEITVLKKQRAKKSKKIQEEVFKTASFLNFEGKSNHLLALFKNTYDGVPLQVPENVPPLGSFRAATVLVLNLLLLPSFGGE